LNQKGKMNSKIKLKKSILVFKMRSEGGSIHDQTRQAYQIS